jgi:hypothetical protein
MNSRNSRNGLILFAVYLLFYGGFVVINAFDPASMERTPIAGLNLAVLYGFGLIIGAVCFRLSTEFCAETHRATARPQTSRSQKRDLRIIILAVTIFLRFRWLSLWDSASGWAAKQNLQRATLRLMVRSHGL